MRRWNGWGDDSNDFPLEPHARAFLEERIGAGITHNDATLEQVQQAVPESRLKAESFIDAGAETRIRHAVGQSYADWWALRTGRFPAFPDGIATPESAADVRSLLDYAKRTGAKLIPYGGGTSVVGHLTASPDDQPVLTVDMGRMNQLQNLDEGCQLATFGAGVSGMDLEKQLRAKGYVLGHFPQSFEYSTLGGWVVTRSSGQQSMRYGRIENIFAGGHLETPIGAWDVPPTPATGAGHDIREMVLGSEGRIGFLTDVIARVRPLPQHESFEVVFFPDWDSGRSAVQAIAHAKLPLSMLRLSNAVETETQLKLAGQEKAIGLLERYLRLRGAGDGKVMLVMGITGSRAETRFAKGEAISFAKKHKGVPAGSTIGKAWAKNRFRGPYVRNSLWDAGYSVDTAETCVTWDKVDSTMRDVEQAARDALGSFDVPAHVFTHLSHVYPQGSSVYSTYIWPNAADADETLTRWHKLKAAVSNAIVANGGTISHQHGVGVDHAPYLPAEKGELGIQAIQSLVGQFDPDGIMNPGKLVTP